ncbi:MAG: triphosphoribosyl-dephospho-CoA synthase CitG [Synergistaceae bacterium]|nr:triphosphoribosyl-dephospho-CoA synthase CitG [Synergistaceae bacterium]
MMLNQTQTMTTTTMRTSKASKNLGSLALESMLIEVSVTPKPGLIDRNNSGAHRDMGFFTFMKSAASLNSCFEDFAQAGVIAGQEKLLPVLLFPELRRIGIIAENDMFRATQGVNTHKGEIFSLGVLSAAAGYLSGMNENIDSDSVMSLAGKICEGLCARDFAESRKKSRNELTKGEKIFIDYNITGIRGEAESGYKSVKDISLPALRKYLSENFTLNDSLAKTLIHLIAFAQDTNIISRHDLETAKNVMDSARKILENGADLDDIFMLDQEFIQRNISPGGSGDLLAVTYFIYELDKNLLL